MLTGRESKWGTPLPPVSISCQVCSPDIDYVQGVGLSLPNEKEEKCLVSLEKPTQISYLLSLALLLKIDRKGWREFQKVILSFLKLRKATPPER